jgi:pimeloyl-ACP methyl ester carboxylesterase
MPAARQLVTNDGLALAWYSWGTPVGVPVVLQHGFAADTASNWVQPGVVDALLTAGRWVVGIDARGHGKSDKPHDVAKYGHRRMSEDVSRLADELHQLFQSSQYDYAGYSMGGYIGVQTIATDRRVRRAVIAAVGAAAAGVGASESDGRQRSPVNRAAIADAMERYAADPTINIRETFTDPDAIGFLRYARYTGADLRALAAQMRANAAPPDQLGQITAAILVLAGHDDHLATSAETLAKALPGAHLVRVPGDHLTAVADPSFIHAMVSFLG